MRYAESDDALPVEGVDDYISSDGTAFCYPYMGVFEFREGLVSQWRDYADSALIAQLTDRTPLLQWLQSLVS